MKRKATLGGSIFVAVIAFCYAVWVIDSFSSGNGPSEEEKSYIMNNGVKCTATLLSIERSDLIVNNIHEYEFTFKVKSDSLGLFQISKEKLVDPIYMPSIKIGMKIPAYVISGSEREVFAGLGRSGRGECI